MFLKRMTRRVGRKRLAYWALVESVRTDRGPRQRVVAHLGELRAGEESGWAKLASQSGVYLNVSHHFHHFRHDRRSPGL